MKPVKQLLCAEFLIHGWSGLRTCGGLHHLSSVENLILLWFEPSDV